MTASIAWRFPKDPDEVLDYDIDWSRQMTKDNDTITSSSWMIPSGLTKDSDSFNDTTTKVTLSGGTDGESYDCENTITTDGGRTFQRTATLQVKSR